MDEKPRYLNRFRFFESRYLRQNLEPDYQRQNFMDSRCSRQNLTHATHEPTLPTPPCYLAIQPLQPEFYDR